MQKLLYTLIIILVSYPCFAQYELAHHLTGYSKEYADKKVRCVTRTDEHNTYNTLYNQQGLPIAYDEGFGNNRIDYDVYDGNKLIAKTYEEYEDNSIYPESIDIIEYDSNTHTITEYSMTYIISETTIAKMRTTYTADGEYSRNEIRYSKLKPHELMNDIYSLTYSENWTSIRAVDSSKDHIFRSSVVRDSTRRITDSTWFENGKKSRHVVHSKSFQKGLLIDSLIMDKAYTYSANTIDEIHNNIFTRNIKTGETKHWRKHYQRILNDKGLEVEYYEIDDEGKRKLLSTTKYEYY